MATKKKVTTRKKRTKKQTLELERKAELNSAIDDVEQKAQAYSIKKTFQVDQLIEHPTFGQGLVKRVIDLNKIEVNFAEENKILMINQ